MSALNDSSVDFICRPWVHSADYWTVHWDLARQVKEAFDAAGISIPFPQTDLHLRLPKDAGGRLPAPVATLAGAAAGAEAGTGRPAGAPDMARGDEGHDRPGNDER